MPAIDQLIADLRADGAVESEGRFTLDREQARAKMQKFQLVDARRYVLELVQAAVLRGATNISFDIDADDMRMRFDGTPFAEAEFDDLYGSLFSDGDGRALQGVRQLALALNAALGMDPKHIHVRSGSTELRMIPGQPDAIRALGKADTRTEIHVRQRFKLRTFVDFFLNLTGRLGEEQYLRQRCRYASIPVSLDGTRIAHGLDHGHEAGTGAGAGAGILAISGADYRGTLRLVESITPCELILIKDGVWIDSKELRRAGNHLVAVIEGDSLRKDVSQARIVENAALERIEAAIVHARWRLWALAHERASGEARLRVAAQIREQLLEYSERGELLEHADARALAAQVVFSECRDRHTTFSLLDLAERAARDGAPLRFSARSFDELSYDDGDPVLLLEDSSVRARLARTLGVDVVSAEDLLARAHRRLEGRKRWLTRLAPAELPANVGYAVRWAFEIEVAKLGRIAGEIGIDELIYAQPQAKAPTHLFMHAQGRLLGRTELALPLHPLWLAVEAAFEPNDEYTDAVRDRTFIGVLLQVLAQLAEPLARLVADAPDEWAEARARGLVKRWLGVMVNRADQVALLTKAGPNDTDNTDSQGLWLVYLPAVLRLQNNPHLCQSRSILLDQQRSTIVAYQVPLIA